MVGQRRFHVQKNFPCLLQIHTEEQRYFNLAGAHPRGYIGEDPHGIPNNRMPFVQQVAVGRRPALTVFGNDYSTNNDTEVRGYIHVVDLADGHIAALNKLEDKKIGCEVYNLGTGKGTSVLEMVSTFEKASGKVASYYGWHVSTTHCIVGSMVEFGLVYGGIFAVLWSSLERVTSSWVISPFVGAAVSFLVYKCIQRFEYNASDPGQATTAAAPVDVFLEVNNLGEQGESK